MTRPPTPSSTRETSASQYREATDSISMPGHLSDNTSQVWTEIREAVSTQPRHRDTHQVNTRAWNHPR